MSQPLFCARNRLLPETALPLVSSAAGPASASDPAAWPPWLPVHAPSGQGKTRGEFHHGRMGAGGLLAVAQALQPGQRFCMSLLLPLPPSAARIAHAGRHAGNWLFLAHSALAAGPLPGEKQQTKPLARVASIGAPCLPTSKASASTSSSNRSGALQWRVAHHSVTRSPIAKP